MQSERLGRRLRGVRKRKRARRRLECGVMAVKLQLVRTRRKQGGR